METVMDFGPVKFDKMEVNTTLAEAYFEKHGHTFKSVPDDNLYLDIGVENDGYNTIKMKKYPKMIYSPSIINLPSRRDKHEMLNKLALDVENNAELFGQIEYKVRKIPVDEVKNFDIKLIVNNLLCRRHIYAWGDYYSTDIMMSTRTPLANIGCIAQLVMMHSDPVRIICCKETAAVCHLFVKLCHNVGLESVKLIITSTYEHEVNAGESYDMTNVQEIMNGCIGVITERSDMDSAVDTFITATTRYPWRLTRLLIQESVYGRFKRIIASKSTQNEHVYICNGKSFSMDYGAIQDTVAVEAYRTTKELLSLITKYAAHFLSVWSSEIAEANEIAFNTPSPVVWLNDYGVFDGPPNASQAIYGYIVTSPCYDISNSLWKDTQKQWAMKSFEERRKTLISITSDSLKQALETTENFDFVAMGNGRLTVGVSKARGGIVLGSHWCGEVMATVMTSGYAVISDVLFTNLYSHNDVPFYRNNMENYKRQQGSAFEMKIVYTNFGTIFAN